MNRRPGKFIPDRENSVIRRLSGAGESIGQKQTDADDVKTQDRKINAAAK